MRWLKSFFTSDDPIVKLVGSLNETEAQMRRELLENNDVPAMVRNMAGDTAAYGAASSFGFALFVKRSDGERAEEILGSQTDTFLAEDGPPEDLDGQGGG